MLTVRVGGRLHRIITSAMLSQCLDEFGQPTPDPLRFPNMSHTAAEVAKRGLKLGLWTIRGVYAAAVAAKVMSMF
eukprot:SAG31_NODE_11665_length_1008_cov_1.199120_1_plen_75_part_00